MTFYAQGDINGNITNYYSDEFDYPSGIPSTAIKITDEQWQDSNDNPGKYIIQNGQLVLSPPPTDDELLLSAKEIRKASLQNDFEASILKGFTSSADGTNRTYAIDQIAMAKWNGTLANINAGMTQDIKLKDLAGNRITLTTVQFKQMASDGFNFFQTQENILWDAEDNVDSIQLANYPTVQDAINAVNAVTL